MIEKREQTVLIVRKVQEQGGDLAMEFWESGGSRRTLIRANGESGQRSAGISITCRLFS